jgi:hypothetical protein
MAAGAPIEIRLERGVSVSGRVMAASGEPVAVAQVSLVEDTSHGDMTLRSFFEKVGGDGRFTFDGVPPDRYKFSVKPTRDVEHALETIDVRGALEGLEIVLDKEAAAAEESEAVSPKAVAAPIESRETPPSIRGTTLDLEGNPVVAVLGVTRDPGSRGFSETVREIVSKPDGSFVLD